MQIIKAILKLDGGTATVVDDCGKPLKTLEIKVGIAATLELDLRSAEEDAETGKLIPYPFAELSGATSYYIAMDLDFDQETEPKMLRFDGITLTQSEDGRTIFRAPIPNTATPGVLDAVKTSETVTVKVEFAGYGGDNPAQAVFAWSYQMAVRNRVYLGGNVPQDVTEDPAYLNTAQVKAEITKQIEDALKNITGEQGPQGVGIADIKLTGTDGLVDTYTITLTDGNTATFTVTNGAEIAKIEKSGSSGLVDTYTITLTDGKTAGTFQVRNGRGIASITKTKSEGNIDTYTITFTDETTFSYQVIHGEKGDTGDDLHIDATGELTERDAYGDEKKGFIFCGSETDAETKITRLYLYVKKSDDYNDWCNPTVITYYSKNGKDGENVKFLLPLEFKAPENPDDFLLSFEMKDYPAATIAHVCIDTQEGEYQLPYNSATGNTKILKKDGKFYVYFGNLVPEYETGRIYFAQGVAEKTLWMLYQEQGGKYSYNDFCSKIFELIGEGETNPDEPEVTGKMYYGYVTAETAGMMTSLTQLTQSIIEAAIEAGTVTECDAAAIGKISMNAPAYSWIVAILPDTLKALKDDGLGGKVAFTLDNGAAGSGANGADLTLGETAYKVYGELQIVTAQTSIYIENKG